MKFASVRELKNRTSEFIRTAAKGNDVLITSHGRPRAILHGLDEDSLEDYVLSHSPQFRREIQEAEEEFREKGAIPIDTLCAQLKARRTKTRGKIRG